jgi:hypothetical protein
VLDVVGTTFLMGGKKCSGSSRRTARSISTRRRSSRRRSSCRSARIIARDSGDRQGRQRPRAEIGLGVSLQPEQPDRLIVTKDEVKQLLDGIPKDMPVLIDEAYHHFVDDPKYATSVPYVIEGGR